ncbi:hypothetical protein CL635_00400 [bacterium]|nr:hypothetical protein [bacterium]|tara:strand:- start:183 stop:1214 length:1032 start_codon:yes stop_codon:yes gene_type:complete
MRKILTSTFCLLLLSACSPFDFFTSGIPLPEAEKEENMDEEDHEETEEEAIMEEGEENDDTEEVKQDIAVEVDQEPKDPNEETIRLFYTYIEDHEFRNAYDLYSVKKVGFEKFQSWYTDVEDVEITDPMKQDDGIYTFTVFLTESNGITGTFDVTMIVEDGKLETKSSKHIRSNEEICHGDTCASIYRNYDRYCILVKMPEAKAPKMPACSSFDAVFVNLRFSPRGKYILYDEEFDTPHGDHVINTHVYSIPALTLVNTLLENVNFVDVVLDDTRVVGCGVPADSNTGYVRIFSLPDGEMVKWEILQEKNPSCRYDSNTQTVIWSDYKGKRQQLNVHTGERLP